MKILLFIEMPGCRKYFLLQIIFLIIPSVLFCFEKIGQSVPWQSESINRINVVVAVKIEKIVKQQKFLNLPGVDRKPLNAVHYNYYGRILWIHGDTYLPKKIRCQLSVPVKYRYDAEDWPMARYIQKRLGSGIETSVRKGQIYIFSFASLGKNRKIQYPIRIDPYKQKQIILDSLKAK
ncbi:hypothetical protein ACFL35_14990 [Candidatus Riflebacteria bacterium]